ncbi:sensor histidine kinase [Shewanella gelidii]|uniref:histidine kinase n=1 Tax=Shewanella gelidii TaxID=1642821 RepID=A0A917JTD2_9GAMM|nr:ATP-binding protein [Shewanella gelidii]MCL1098689.1 ATP-binding protein [Shewanella gelidii]GGI86032.1 hypothetical protein GCM10009332_24210 [Shewanella gelidii]
MSIKRYVFLVFGTLIVLLGLSQIFIAQYFKDQLQAQLQTSSRALSQDIIDVVIEQAGDWPDLLDDMPQEEFERVISMHPPSQPQVSGSDLPNHEVLEEILSERQHHALAQELAEELSMVDDEIAKMDESVHELATQIKDIGIQYRANPDMQAQKERAKHKAKVVALMQKETQAIQKERQQIVALQKQAAKVYEQRLKEAVRNIEIRTEDWLDSGRVMIVQSRFDTAPKPIPSKVVQEGITGLPDESKRLNMHEGLNQASYESLHSQGSTIRELQLASNDANNGLEQFSETIFVLIGLSCVIALFLTYWLSHHVSQPLIQLRQGHQQLGSGQLGIQVKESGIEEIKQILAGFNGMSRQLASLSEKTALMTQQQNLADIGQITRGIAHSLRNPLHTLGLLSDQLSQEVEQSTRFDLAQKVQQKIAHMDKSIQALLTLAAGSVSRSQAIPIQGVIQDILLELSIGGSKLDVTGLTTQEDENSYLVMGAESEVRSILHAVIINAVEACEQRPRVAIDLRQEGRTTVVEITDWGKGIDEQVRGHLFEPHVTTKTEGSGMGIYIASKLVESHYGGEIRYRDNPDGGTIATVTFQIDKAGE